MIVAKSGHSVDWWETLQETRVSILDINQELYTKKGEEE
jgi:hypothetical protein